MEVHFCDLCNESVPQRDLDLGRAFLHKGRVICAACDVAMGGEAARAREASLSAAGAPAGVAFASAVFPPERASAPPLRAVPAPAPAPATAPAGGGLALGLAALAVLLTAAVAVLLFERLDESSRAAAGVEARLRGELREGLDAERAAASAAVAARADDAARLERELAALSERGNQGALATSEALARLTEQVSELTARAAAEADDDGGEELARHDRELEALAASLSVVRGDIGLMAEKLFDLERRPAAAPPPAATAPQAAPAAADPAAWTALALELKSPSSGARWSAVQALGDTRDLAVVPHLLPMLKDADIFVRMATARVLGDLASRDAVPSLIDALEDEEPSVREQASVSLRAITGKDFKFDPTANEAERAKKVKAWRDWWKREGESAAG
jgi:HEAT repeat protein